MMKKLITIGSVLFILVLILTSTAMAGGRLSPELMRGAGIHHEMYMILLSEKYTPELTSEWEIEFDRRDSLIDEFKKLGKDQQERNQILQYLEEIKNRLKNIEDKINADKMKRGRDQSEFQKMPEFPRERFYKQKDHPQKNWGLTMDKNRELFHKFTEAIEAGDEAQIKTLLPQLFQQLKENNQQMEEQLELLKNRIDR